jgi:MFS transporter, DHA1 family, multidrug resistance protein
METSGRHAGSQHWRATLFAVCAAQATAIVGFDFTLPFIPLYLQQDLGIHGLGHIALWSGLIGFGPAIPATIFAPLWGRFADRFGYRPMLIRAMVCAAILLTLMGFVPSPWVLLVLRMIQGALTGTTYAAQALVASAVPEDETGRAMGLLQMSVFLGATFGPVGGGAVAALIDFRAAYIAAGILIGLATIVVVLFVREPERKIARTAEPAKEKRSLGSVLLIPAFAAALGITLVVQLAGTAILPVVPLFVQSLLHSARNVPTDTGWLLAVSGLSAGVGSYVTGRLSKQVALRPLLAGALAVSGLLFLPQAFAGNYLQLLVLRSLSACAYGGMIGLVGTLGAVSSPKDARGVAFGLMGSASSIGFGAGPLLGGALVAAVGIRPVFLLSGALLLVLPVVFIGAIYLSPRIALRRSPIPSLTGDERAG